MTWLKTNLDVARGVMARGGARYLLIFLSGRVVLGSRTRFKQSFRP